MGASKFMLPVKLSHGITIIMVKENRPSHGKGQPIWTNFSLYGVPAMLSLMADIIGMAGTSLVVGAFFLLQLNKVSPKGLVYNLMNLVGALFLLFSLCINFNLASFVIEIFWIAASLIGLYNYIKTKP